MKAELHQKSERRDGRSGAFDEVAGGQRCAAGGQHVIHHQHPFSSGDGVDVQFQRVLPIFQAVGFAVGGQGRSLEGFRTGMKPLAQGAGERGTEDEATGLDAHHVLHLERGHPRRQRGDDAVKQGGVGQHRRQVLEDDARLGKVRNVPNSRPDRLEQGGNHG